MARCHRIGQKKQVTIYRLITRRLVCTIFSIICIALFPFSVPTLSLLLSNFPHLLHLTSISTSRAISYVSSSPIPSSSPSFPLRSFEAEMFERASKKLGLEQAVLGTRQFNDNDVRCCNGDAFAFRSWPLILIHTASCTVFSTFSSWNVYLHMLLFQHTHICARSIPRSSVIASSTPFAHPFFHTVLLTYHSSILFFIIS